MLAYTSRRLVQLVPTVFGVVTIVFLMVRFLPGDPAEYIAGETAPPETLNRIRVELGLNDSWGAQYVRYVTNLTHFDLGHSLKHTGVTVASRLGAAMPVTVGLGGISLVLGFMLAVPLGAMAAYYASKGKTAVDTAITGSALVVDVIPGFWLGLVLLGIFTVRLGWFPASGELDFSDPVSLTRRLFMPVLVLAVSQLGAIARVTRTAVLEVLNEDYIRTAKAMGTPEITVVFRHALKNAALPVVTVAGLSFGRLLGGTVIVETIFALPGMGTLLVEAIVGRDYSIVQGAILLYATLFILVNLITDIVYTQIDPRVKL